MAEESIRAVDRALAILRAFTSRDTALTLTEIARRTELNKTTTLRLLGTLEQHRCVVRLPAGTYRPGPALAQFGTVFRDSLQLDEQVMPALQGLTQATGESSAYFVRDGDARRCQFRVDGAHAVRDQLQVGQRVPLTSGSYSHVLTRLDSVGSRTPNAAVVIASCGERDPQMASIAAPVFGEHQQLLGTLGISMPAFRFDDALLARAAPLVLQAAISVTELLGGDTAYLQQAGANGWQLYRGSAA